MARRKNPRLKSSNQETEFTVDMLNELKKCAQDAVYFVENYIMIVNNNLGAIKFKLYDYQRDMIRSFQNNKDTIVLSARQSGKSIVSSAFLLWYVMFNFDKTVLIASNKNSNAMEMIARIQFAYENLPDWIKPGIQEDKWNKHELGFDNNSRIISTATSEDSGRGLTVGLLYADELGFVPPNIADEFWTSMMPTLSTGGRSIVTSTPNGDSNLFAQLWRGAELGANGYYPIYIPWDMVPGRDESFKNEFIGKIGPIKWAQEFECLSSGTRVVIKLGDVIKEVSLKELEDILC